MGKKKTMVVSAQSKCFGSYYVVSWGIKIKQC